MSRIGDIGWAIRDRAGGIALVLALLGCGAGAAGIVIALDAKDKAEDAAAAAASTPATAPTAPVDSDLEGTVDELNERVAAIEESVSLLREELDTEATTTEETTTPDGGGTTTPTPDVPELPEGIDIPGVGKPESESP
ncbi:MAG TPA: hypothetical protein VFY99_06660 [Solirubrobacterales bacterium]